MRLVRTAAWIVLLILGSVAAAGLVVSLDHPASGDARPELTARDAAILAPRLAALGPSLDAMAVEAAALSDAGRQVLVTLRAGAVDQLPAALETGDAALAALGAAGREVRSRAPTLLAGLGTGEGLPDAARARVAAIGAAASAVDELTVAWDSLGAATLVPAALAAALDRHDAAIGDATAAGRDSRYPDASQAMKAAAAALADAQAERDRAIAAGHPTPALDDLLARIAARDAALHELYRRLAEAGSVRTPEVEAALAAVDATQSALDDPAVAALGRALTEAGAGDVTASLLRIDEARGVIEAAREAPSPAP